MKEIEYIDDWRKIKNAEIIDVRSPSEFNICLLYTSDAADE